MINHFQAIALMMAFQINFFLIILSNMNFINYLEDLINLLSKNINFINKMFANILQKFNHIKDFR